MNKKTVTYQLHTRRLDREVARHKMKKAGVIQLNKDKGMVVSLHVIGVSMYNKYDGLAIQ